MKRTVQTVADLRPKHFGKRIRIPDLVPPGEDFDARVTVRGTLCGLTSTRDVKPGRTIEAMAKWLWVDIQDHGRRMLDRPLPLTHPCFLVAEDPPPEPEPVAVAFDEMEG